MPKHQLARVVKQVRALAGVSGADDASDRDLLRRYLAAHDDAAFACLMQRYGSMVLGLCKKLLRHEQDAEDAFQATFLVFARKAGSIRQHESVGGWLYSVAFRVANKLRASQTRRRARENPLSGDAPGRTSEDLSWREVQQVLYAELDRLADKYRAPLLLCYVQGKTRDEAAHLLGCELGVLRGRLERGRDILRARLVRRGLSLSATLLAVGMAETASAAAIVPVSLFSATVQAAMSAAKSTASVGSVSASVAALTQGVLRAMFLTKLKSTALGLLGLAVVSTGIGLVSFETSAQESGTALRAGAQKATQPTQKTNDDLDPRKLKEENERLRRELEQVRKELLAALRENVRLREEAQAQRDAAQAEREQAQREYARRQADLAKRHAYDALLSVRDAAKATPANDAKAAEKRADLTRATAAVTADGKVLAVGSDKGVSFLDVATGKKLTFIANGPDVTSLAFSPDGKVLAAGSSEKTVRLWDVPTGKEIRRIAVPRAATEIRFGQDGKYLIVIEMDGARLEIDVGSGAIRAVSTKDPTKSK